MTQENKEYALKQALRVSEDKCSMMNNTINTLSDKVKALNYELETIREKTRMDTIKEFEEELGSHGIIHSDPVIRVILGRMKENKYNDISM